MSLLPIEEIKECFLAALETEQTMVLSAPPGAGKSTCLPLWLLQSPALRGKKIYLLQPRRVAAKSIAQYLATQIQESVGQTVGYRLRDESKVSANTRLEVITEGILTQIIQNDPELDGCGMIVFDEFHERSLQADLAFALARDVQQGLRDDLTLLLMSATLHIQHLSSHLPDAKVLHSAGRCFDVSVSYQAPSNIKLWRAHALKVIKQALIEYKESILVFLPSSFDITYLHEELFIGLSEDIQLCPLYGDLSLQQQKQAIAAAPDGKRKLVLATNIAETSLTIDGISVVIDSGLEKVACFNPQTLTTELKQQDIAKASAIQRMGRAGRVMAGHCIRLYAKETFQRKQDQKESEIQQADLLPLLIEAARWGVSELKALPLLELPSDIKENHAWETLKQLSLVDHKRGLTQYGKKVSAYACHPRFAHMIESAAAVESRYRGMTYFACVMAALLEERDIFSYERSQQQCDFRQRIHFLLNQATSHDMRYQRIFKQAKRLLKKSGNKEVNAKQVERLLSFTGVLLACAYPERIAQLRGNKGAGDGEFVTMKSKGISVSVEDALASEPYIVAAVVGGKVPHSVSQKVRLAAPVLLDELLSWNVVKLEQHESVYLDQALLRICAEKQQCIGDLVVEKSPLLNVTQKEAVAKLWQQQVVKKGLAWLGWQKNDIALLQRWRWLNQYQAQANLPDVSEACLLTNLDSWFTPFVGEIKNKKQLDKLSLSQMLLSLLDYQQTLYLKAFAPTEYIGPTGRRCPITYNDEPSPKVSLPMQEVYGLATTPQVGDVNQHQGIPLVLELLSPAQRPIQITQDLAAFWQGSYALVQKDMKSRYPKHFWPDDPANAQPTNKTARHHKK